MSLSACARCAQRGPTCCRLTPGDEEYCFPLSELERARILDHCCDAGGFALQLNSPDFIENLERLFPGEDGAVRALFPRNKFHYRLAVDAEGACRFLRPDGCSLPRDIRPYYCRLFPFWFAEREMTFFQPAGCVAVEEGRTVNGVCSALRMGKREIRDLYGRLRLAWGLPPLAGMRPVKKTF